MRRARLICCALAACSLMPVTPAQARSRGQMVRAINHSREIRGLAPLAVSNELRNSSRSHAGWMISTGFFGHHATVRTSAAFRCVGEVLSMHDGTRARVHTTLRAWLRSPTHRAVLLNPIFRNVGAGRASGPFKGRPSTMWTVHLGCPRQ